MSSQKKSQKKMTHEEFAERAIKALRKPPHKTIHVVYSGFNEAFRQYFGEDPRPIVDKMVGDGFLNLRVVKGGAIIGLSSEKNDLDGNTGSAALAKILSK